MGVTGNARFADQFVQACARGFVEGLPPFPTLYPAPRPFRSTHNGGPPLEGRKPGRPTVDCVVVREHILNHLADGAPLREICRAEGVPDRATIFRWRARDPEFNRMVEVAAEEGRHRLVEVVHEQRLAAIATCTPKQARRWWNIRRKQLIRINPRFFGRGPR
jgi:hypothetical protein